MKLNYVLLGVAIGLAIGFLAGHTLNHYSITQTGSPGLVIKINNNTGETWRFVFVNNEGEWHEVPNKEISN